MERSREEEKKQSLKKEIKNGNENENGMAKSCKGFLYYSSALKSRNRNPLCIGFPRSLPQVKSHRVGLAETKAYKKATVLEDFKYVCAGYSEFLRKNEGSIHKDGIEPQLPHCRGLVYLQHLIPPTVDTASAHARVHSGEDRDIHQHRTHKPTHAVEDEFLNRFTRTAKLVASRVARDMCKVGNNLKNKVEDILFPNRRPPK